jgi:hypothetical protein
VDGRPVFTAWSNREQQWVASERRTRFFSAPGNWVELGSASSYLNRVRQAMANHWACRVIWLEGEEPWTKVKYAYFDTRYWCVQFTFVGEDGRIEGDLLPQRNDVQT